MELVELAPFVHEGVEFDDTFRQTTPLPVDGDINGRDALGRTPLVRAARRDYERQVEELLEAGAGISIPDAEGRTILDLTRQGRISGYIAWMIENAGAGRGRI